MESFSRYKICQSTVELVTRALKKVGKYVKTSKIVVLGVAYKGEVDDTRNSARMRLVS